MFWLFYVALLLMSRAVWGEGSEELLNRANENFTRGRITKAIELYAKVSDQDPAHLYARLNLAVAYRTLLNNDKAIQYLTQAYKLAEKNTEILCELGNLHAHENHWDQAHVYFSKALELDPAHPGALFGMGLVNLRQDHAAQAVVDWEKLKELKGNYSPVYYFLGQAYEKKGENDHALEHYVQTLQKDWTFAEARYALAAMYMKMEKWKPAWKQYNQIESFDPKNKEVQKALDFCRNKVSAEFRSAADMERLPFTPVATIPNIKKPVQVRIGLWTSPSGLPTQAGKIKFQVNSNFKLVGVKTGKVFAQGKKGEEWTAVYKQKRVSDILTPQGESLGPFAHAVCVEPFDAQSTFLIQEVRDLSGSSRPYVRGREYRGKMLIFPHPSKGIYLVNELDLEEYLLGVLPAEMPATWPLEALKAQAVIARNYALFRMRGVRAHKKAGFDICDCQHCQVYKGVIEEKESSVAAVTQTLGQVLYADGSLVEAYYHANCGGHTQSARDVRGWGKYAYLQGILDRSAVPGRENKVVFPSPQPWDWSLWIKSFPPAYCNLPELISSSEYRWLRIIPVESFERMLNKRYRIGQLQEVLTLTHSPSGNVNELLLSGSKRKVVLNEEHLIRKYMGLESLRSTLFVVEAQRDAQGRISEYWVYGGGWGHGIGLCQSGAAGMAKAGKTYQEILSFYYSGAHLN